MRTKILTLRFSPQVGGFDDGPLLTLQQKVVLTQLREHLVQVGDETVLVCVAKWREQPHGASTAPPRMATPLSERPVRADTEPTRCEPASPAAGSSPRAISGPALSDDSGIGRRGAPGPAVPVGALRADLTAEQRVLFDRVRSWRSRTAHQEGAPPYVILTNRQLVELVLQRPDSKVGIGRIHGLGAKKIARHGDALLQMLWAKDDVDVASEGGASTDNPDGPDANPARAPDQAIPVDVVGADVSSTHANASEEVAS